MRDATPVVSSLLDLFLKAIFAVPFWLIWTLFGLGEKYFYFLPPVYHTPDFLSCVGLFIVVPILYRIFVPQLLLVSQSNKNNLKDD